MENCQHLKLQIFEEQIHAEDGDSNKAGVIRCVKCGTALNVLPATEILETIKREIKSLATDFRNSR